MEKRNVRNDSSQMKDLLQFDDQDDGNKNSSHEKQQGSNNSSTQASCSSSAGPRSAAGVCRTDDHEAASMQWTENASSCCQLDRLKRLPQCDTKLEPLTFSKSHTVLIDVGVFRCGAGPIPQDGRDLWHKNFVKMPCSPQSTAFSTKLDLKVVHVKGSVQRWKLISKQLTALASKKTASVDEVAEAILTYNPKYKGQWSFDGLSRFVKFVPKAENYFETLFPKIAALALKLPDQVKKAIPLLQRGQAAAITLSQVQISCLLANAFFCTFPHRNTSSPDAEYHSYPTINFTRLFADWSERKKEKLRAIMHYFNVVSDEKTKLTGLVTFERCFLRDTDMPNWRNCKETLQKLHLTSQGSIETEGTGMLQVDFACSLIGGGVLDSGLVQEEILFLMNPELIVSRLFTEKLADNECLIITGSQKFSCYSGYSDRFEWAGPYEDDLERDKWDRLKRQILAIDALHFKHRREQYRMARITRELNKAYCGFKHYHGHHGPDIATGKWGCGAFKGDPQLKAVIQLMAAAKAKRGLAFFTFGDEELKRGLEQIYHLLVTEKTTVGKLYEVLEDYCAVLQEARGTHVDLFEFIRGTIRPSRSLL
ncbi:poly(ADP-ribose) glycohydrolase [Kryptolebias marmoratus]|uniref:poly(ADP-ribose) glycohydrolase n=1 Tax=Kryptolebias marmoratus TaxID=37003 RepID=A0A3Q3BBY9_KRYMA|nr:poly(ADP-ribose) glycohydrolase [Kryptolebias marmoratus]